MDIYAAIAVTDVPKEHSSRHVVFALGKLVHKDRQSMWELQPTGTAKLLGIITMPHNHINLRRMVVQHGIFYTERSYKIFRQHLKCHPMSYVIKKNHPCIPLRQGDIK